MTIFDRLRAGLLIVLAASLTLVTARPAIAGSPPYAAPPQQPNLSFGTIPETRWMSPQAVELITNGGFESGGTGWYAYDQAGSGGSWFLFGGPGAGPLSTNPIPAPAQGAWQAITDQTGPGTHILYQDVTIPALASATLNLVLWYNNLAGTFNSPPTLDFNATPNQQARIDIMKPAAPIDDLGPGVLLNVFATGPASPVTLGYTPITANLDAFAGQTIRLRFVEVDDLFYFNVGVDAVSIQAEEITPVRAVTWGSVKGRYR